MASDHNMKNDTLFSPRYRAVQEKLETFCVWKDKR